MEPARSDRPRSAHHRATGRALDEVLLEGEEHQSLESGSARRHPPPPARLRSLDTVPLTSKSQAAFANCFCKSVLRLYRALMTSPERPSASWFDPAQDEVLTATQLRIMAHPIRQRILRLLRGRGPNTATGLAALIGHSSGVTSYHLRIMAEHGHVVEDLDRGNDRDRWWRSARRNSSVSFRGSHAKRPGAGESDPDDVVELAEQFFRISAQAGLERSLEYIDTLSSRREELATLPWQMSDWPLRMTKSQAHRFAAQINDLAAQYRLDPDRDTDEDADELAPEDRVESVIFQFQLLPDDAAAPGPVSGSAR